MRSRYLFDVCYYFFYIPNQKKELLLFYICSRGHFTYLDNNIGINRKITRNCLFATYTVCCCLFAKLCLSFEVQRTVQCGTGVNQKSMWPIVKSRGREGEWEGGLRGTLDITVLLRGGTELKKNCDFNVNASFFALITFKCHSC